MSGVSKHRQLRSRFIYLTLIFLIGFISCYDNMLSVVYHESLRQMEENPIGRFLIDEIGVHGFVAVKSFTTVIAIIILYALSLTRRRYIIWIIFFLQALLMFYLNADLSGGHSCRSPVGDVVRHFVYGEKLLEFR